MNSSSRLRRSPVLGVTVLALLLGGCGALGGDDQTPTASERKTRDKKPAKSDSPAPTDSSTSSGEGSSGDMVAVPAYFAGDAAQGTRLFREFRAVDSADPLTGAAALLTRGDVLDPDYRTLFPSGAFASVSYDEAAGTLTAELADDGWTTRPDQMSAAEAKLAVQQLVYTLQGVAQTRDPLTVTFGGQAVALFGVDTSKGVRNRQDALALVNVTVPEQGAVLSGSFTASGVANSFEANVPWEVRQNGKVVTQGFATAAGWMDKLYPWEATVNVADLPPGDYEFVARTDDPSDGEGFGPTEDSKAFTIK